MKKNLIDINPIINMNEANAPIELGSFATEINGEQDFQKKGDAKWVYQFLPKPRLHCFVPLDNPLLGLSLGSYDSYYNIELFENQFKGMNAEINNDYLKLMPCRDPIQIIHNNDQTNSVIFHVFNFVDFLGAKSFFVEEGKMSIRINYLTLEHKDWLITISGFTDTSERIKKVKAKGGYVITHVGRLEKKDGSSFNIRDSQNVLSALKYMLSFSVGKWVSPGFQTGLNEKKDKIWEEWGIGSCDSYSYKTSWLDTHNVGVLSDIFPNFCEMFEDEVFGKVLKDTVYWYLIANDFSSGVDKGVVASQIILEKLAWHYLVNIKKGISEEGFNKLRASDCFRLLLTYLEIPTNIPDICVKLKNKRSDNDWDAPWAITDVRNSLVHPKVKSKNNDYADAYYETWKLSLWLIEMVVLRLLDFNGVYSNRLIDSKYVGEVENPPWVGNI